MFGIRDVEKQFRRIFLIFSKTIGCWQASRSLRREGAQITPLKIRHVKIAHLNARLKIFFLRKVENKKQSTHLVLH
jgi:hypothetical protein